MSELKKILELKKESEIQYNLNKKLYLLDDHREPIYRFFKKECEADALVQGKVWLSTMNTCRAYEDAEQGDKEEAYETYNSGYLVGDGDDPDFVRQAKQAGVSISPGSKNCGVIGCVSRSFIEDSYVLCTTLEFSPEELGESFGKYCVEITDPKGFFYAVSKSIEKQITIIEAGAGKITYKDRSYSGMELEPGQIGFVKPEYPYSPQKEYRFVWLTENSDELTPFLLDCPEVSTICKRIL